MAQWLRCCATNRKVPGGKRLFPSPQRLDRLWGQTSLLLNGCRGSFSRGLSGRSVMLTNDLHLVPKLPLFVLYLLMIQRGTTLFQSTSRLSSSCTPYLLTLQYNVHQFDFTSLFHQLCTPPFLSHPLFSHLPPYTRRFPVIPLLPVISHSSFPCYLFLPCLFSL